MWRESYLLLAAVENAEKDLLFSGLLGLHLRWPVYKHYSVENRENICVMRVYYRSKRLNCKKPQNFLITSLLQISCLPNEEIGPFPSFNYVQAPQCSDKNNATRISPPPHKHLVLGMEKQKLVHGALGERLAAHKAKVVLINQLDEQDLGRHITNQPTGARPSARAPGEDIRINTTERPRPVLLDPFRRAEPQPPVLPRILENVGVHRPRRRGDGDELALFEEQAAGKPVVLLDDPAVDEERARRQAGRLLHGRLELVEAGEGGRVPAPVV